MDNQELQNESVSQLFDGNTIAPQFALALKNFFLKNMGIRATGGQASIATTGSQQTFAHGLGVTPTVYGITPAIFQSAGSPYPICAIGFDPAKPPDATYFYLKGSGNENGTITFSWFALYIPIQ